MPPSTASTAPVPLERRSEWAGLREGDPVDVLDDRERGATWQFAAHVTNAATTATWIEVVGGRRGEQRRRSFRPDQVYPKDSVRGGATTSASLDDAPRLPF
jgi:hypothetical protein